MRQVFVNLKRFEVSRTLGGVCPVEGPVAWIQEVVGQCINIGLGSMPETRLVFFLPEALIYPALEKLGHFPPEQTRTIEVGCQGVFREDISKGGNFGAFTTNLPATAAKSLGCQWSMIGHSEERSDKLQLLQAYDPSISSEQTKLQQALDTVNNIISHEVRRAMDAGLNVLLCVGETTEEQPRIVQVLRRQLELSLGNVKGKLKDRKMIVAYEPVWAIGPGKTTPDREYIEYTSKLIKSLVQELFDYEAQVVYGGGLKRENASMLGGIATCDGGLVALTRFSGEIGFFASDLKEIIEQYSSGLGVE